MRLAEITNIPMSFSILHEREYNNLCIAYKLFDNKNKRRAFSEKSTNNEKINSLYNNSINNNRSITPHIGSFRVLKN
jgi:hypothetical protein